MLPGICRDATSLSLPLEYGSSGNLFLPEYLFAATAEVPEYQSTLVAVVLRPLGHVQLYIQSIISTSSTNGCQLFLSVTILLQNQTSAPLLFLSLGS